MVRFVTLVSVLNTLCKEPSMIYGWEEVLSALLKTLPIIHSMDWHKSLTDYRRSDNHYSFNHLLHGLHKHLKKKEARLDKKISALAKQNLDVGKLKAETAKIRAYIIEHPPSKVQQVFNPFRKTINVHLNGWPLTPKMIISALLVKLDAMTRNPGTTTRLHEDLSISYLEFKKLHIFQAMNFETDLELPEELAQKWNSRVETVGATPEYELAISPAEEVGNVLLNEKCMEQPSAQLVRCSGVKFLTMEKMISQKTNEVEKAKSDKTAAKSEYEKMSTKLEELTFELKTLTAEHTRNLENETLGNKCRELLGDNFLEDATKLFEATELLSMLRNTCNVNVVDFLKQNLPKLKDFLHTTITPQRKENSPAVSASSQSNAGQTSVGSAAIAQVENEVGGARLAIAPEAENIVNRTRFNLCQEIQDCEPLIDKVCQSTTELCDPASKTEEIYEPETEKIYEEIYKSETEEIGEPETEKMNEPETEKICDPVPKTKEIYDSEPKTEEILGLEIDKDNTGYADAPRDVKKRKMNNTENVKRYKKEGQKKRKLNNNTENVKISKKLEESRNVSTR